MTKLDLQPGDQVTVKISAGQRTNRQHVGRVLGVYDRFILIQLKNFRECVNIGALLAGDEMLSIKKEVE